jgi:hypothetical protein
MTCTDTLFVKSCGLLSTSVLSFKSRGLTKCKVLLLANHLIDTAAVKHNLRRGWENLCAADIVDIPKKATARKYANSAHKSMIFFRSLPDRCSEAPLHLALWYERSTKELMDLRVPVSLPLIRQHLALLPEPHFFASGFY